MPPSRSPSRSALVLTVLRESVTRVRLGTRYAPRSPNGGKPRRRLH
ncbi:hypothetical protein L083_0522 [Actinoplanes sp. N902-109]|nr:hypothetical protein L083_0522 [Actinoplanes sp. N902-109]